jgi:GNAT superfamily N-acetyltransferase
MHDARRVPLACEVVPLDAQLLARNARMLAAAFEVDPAYCYLMPDAATRAAGLADFFERNQRVHLPYRCTHLARMADGSLGATVTLRPPGGIAISTLTLLRHGLVPFALRHGRDAVKRLLWLKDTYDALELAAAKGALHHYVHMMAVRPDVQGRGLGSQLLEEVLARGTAARSDLTTVLTTHLEENIVFYRRAGFEVVDERVLQPPRGEPYRVWSMVRA